MAYYAAELHIVWPLHFHCVADLVGPQAVYICKGIPQGRGGNLKGGEWDTMKWASLWNVPAGACNIMGMGREGNPGHVACYKRFSAACRIWVLASGSNKWEWQPHVLDHRQQGQ